MAEKKARILIKRQQQYLKNYKNTTVSQKTSIRINYPEKFFWNGDQEQNIQSGAR